MNTRVCVFVCVCVCVCIERSALRLQGEPPGPTDPGAEHWSHGGHRPGRGHVPPRRRYTAAHTYGPTHACTRTHTHTHRERQTDKLKQSDKLVPLMDTYVPYKTLIWHINSMSINIMNDHYLH